MSFKQALKYMPLLFCGSSAFFFAAISITAMIFEPDKTFSAGDILVGFLVALLVSLPVFVLVSRANATRLELNIRKILHFLLSMGLAFFSLIYFGLITWENGVYAIIAFTVTYLAGYTIMEIRYNKLAKKLNERINALHDTEIETDSK